VFEACLDYIARSCYKKKKEEKEKRKEGREEGRKEGERSEKSSLTFFEAFNYGRFQTCKSRLA
jgi:predicted transposase YdaD